MERSATTVERHDDSVALAMLAETSPDAIITIDEQRRIVSANPATEMVLGYAPADLIGRPLSMLIPQRLRAAHEAGVARYLATGRRTIPWSGVRLTVLTKGGREIPVEIAFGTFVDANGSRFFSGFIRDVSQWVRHEQELDAARAAANAASREATRLARAADAALEQSERHCVALQDALRMRDVVLSVVSHDLRNPLNAIVMSATGLRELQAELKEPDRRQLIDVICRSALQANRLILDLLDIGRIETGRFSVALRREDPTTIVLEACEQFRPVVEQHGQTLGCHIAPHMPAVQADRDRVVQLLSNFLNNAVKFTPKGGHISVDLDTDVNGDVCFAVGDNGTGIPAEDLGHVFDGFWQSKGTAHLGAGLGLGIARGVAAAHGGKVWAESAVGCGSTFYFELPASRRSPPTDDARWAPTRRSGSDLELTRFDNRANRISPILQAIDAMPSE